MKHDDDCMCPACLDADMTAHLVSIGQGKLAMTLAADPAYAQRDTSVRTRYATPGQRAGSGVVRTVSPKQVRFIKRLLTERDTTNLVRLPGSENVERMSLRGARDLIDRLLACPMKVTVPAERQATPKQIEWLQKLTDREVTGHAATVRASAVDGRPVTFDDASKALDVLFKAPRVRPAAQHLVIGAYLFDGTVCRVAKSRQSQRLYAMRWDAEMRQWDYVAGLINSLRVDMRMTMEQMHAFGAEFHFCAVCGRDITNKTSVERGIGPICYGRQQALLAL